jgi:hypothetical protein
MYKNHTAEIEFCFPQHKHGKDAYAIKYMKGNTELHRLCFEDELSYQDQVNIDDVINSKTI